jgi:hypothetical protein
MEWNQQVTTAYIPVAVRQRGSACILLLLPPLPFLVLYMKATGRGWWWWLLSVGDAANTQGSSRVLMVGAGNPVLLC